MKNSRRVHFETTVGDLIASLSEETDRLRGVERIEKDLLIASLLNELLSQCFAGRRWPFTAEDWQ